MRRCIHYRSITAARALPEAGHGPWGSACHTRSQRPVGSLRRGLTRALFMGLERTATPFGLRHRSKGMSIVTVRRSEEVIGEIARQVLRAHHVLAFATSVRSY